MIIYFKKIIKCACCALLFSGEGQAFEESHEVSFDISQVKETSLLNSLTKKALEGDGGGGLRGRQNVPTWKRSPKK